MCTYAQFLRKLFVYFFKHWIRCHVFSVGIFHDGLFNFLQFFFSSSNLRLTQWWWDYISFWLYFLLFIQKSHWIITIFAKRMLQPKQKTVEIAILTIVVRNVIRLNPLHSTVCKWGAQRAPALQNDTSFETFLCACWSIVFHVLGDKGVTLKQCKDTNDCLKRLTYSRALEPGNHLCHFKLWNIILRAQGLKISLWVSVNDWSLLRSSWPESMYVFNNGSDSRAACKQIRFWWDVFFFFFNTYFL